MVCALALLSLSLSLWNSVFSYGLFLLICHASFSLATCIHFLRPQSFTTASTFIACHCMSPDHWSPVCGLSLLSRILWPWGQGLALPFSVAPLRVLGTYYVFIGSMEMHRGFWGRLGVWFNLYYSWNFRFPRYKRIAWVLPNYGSQWPKISMAKFKWAGLKSQKNMTG